jgi:hypothetical protein
MRTTLYSALLTLLAAGVMPAGTVSLTGGGDLVAFNASKMPFVITLGEICTEAPNSTCTYGGTQTLDTGTLAWQFQTPNTESLTWTFDPDDLSGPTGGTFSASDGVDSFAATYTFSTWNDDGTADAHGHDGVDLNGTLTITNVTLAGSSDPNQGAFESLFSLPGTTSYNFTLDVGDCTGGSKYVACINVPDPSAQFLSLTLTPETSTPEPGTLAPMAAGLLFVLGARRLRKAVPGTARR